MVRKFYLFTVMTALFMLVAPSLRAQQSGACGDNLTWTLDADGVLTISGTGAMTDFPYNGSAPWEQSPRKVVIKNGVTTIGTFAFGSCASMTSIEIPNSVTSIGHDAFMYAGLTSVDIPNSVTSVGEGAFYSCGALTSINIPSSVTNFPDYVFCNCSGLKSVNIPSSVTSIGENAFFNCTGLTSIDIPNSVTSIENSAFCGCSGLKKIESKAETPPVCGEMVFMEVEECVLYVPEKSIETYKSTAPWSDFSSIEALQAKVVASGTCGESVTWSLDDEGVLTIEGTGAMEDYGSDNGAPWADKSVKSVVIGEGVTTIGSYAFRGCDAMASVDIAGTVTSIREYAFRDCEGLTSVTLPNSVTSVGMMAFGKCSGLTSVTLPNSLTSMGSYMFYKCEGLTSVTIPSTVKSIAERVFSKCSGLTKIECLAGEAPVCDDKAFDDLNMEKCVLYVPKASIEAYKVANVWKDFTNIEALTAKVVATGDCGDNITWTLDDQGVLTLEGTGAMEDYSSDKVAPWADMSVKSVVIGDGVTTIGDYAFRGCEVLTSVTVSNSVTSIGQNAFSGCYGLTSIDIPSSVTSIGESAFDGCSALTSIDIPSSVTSIAGYAFSMCSKLTSVTIPSSVTKIGDYAFSFCSELKKVQSQAATPPACGSDVFYAVSNCVLYVPEKSVETYKTTAPWNKFSSIEALPVKVVATGDCGESVTWSLDDQGVLTIEGTGAMDNYYSMDNVAPWRELSVTSVVIGDGVTTIGDYAFYRKSDITSVTIPSSVTSIQQFAFGYCSGLTSVDISNSVTSIGSYAFYGTGLTSVTVPSSITEIVNSVFDSCTGLKSVIIPSTVTTIGGYAFNRCTSLEKIECLAVTPPTCESTTFYQTDKSKCELIVPKGSVEDYKTADEWKDFYSIVAGINGMSQDSKVAVSASNGVITVTGTTDNAVVEVYSISGMLVYRGTSNTVAVPSAGIYVVKAAGKTFKVNAAR